VVLPNGSESSEHQQINVTEPTTSELLSTSNKGNLTVDTSPSRRSSYIDVVGLSDDPYQTPVSGAGPTVDTVEDSEDEDKLVINEGDNRKEDEDMEVLTVGSGVSKRPAPTDSEEDGGPKKKLRVVEEDKKVINLTSKPVSVSPMAGFSASSEVRN